MSMSWDHEVLRQLDEREAADSGSELSDHDEAPMELCEEVSTVLPSTDPASTVDENAALRQLSSLRHHISSLEEVGVRSNEGSAERAAAELSSDSPLNQEENVGLLWPKLLSFTIAYITCYNSIGDIANYLLLLHSKAECC